jgi:hypothetical protein
MIGAKITITPELAIRVGALAEHYQDASVEIAYDDSRDERLWQVTFELWASDDATGKLRREEHRYIVDDETGIAKADTSHFAS